MRANNLQVRALCKSYEDRMVLNHLDLDAEAGRSMAIVGPSGCGKTTLLNLIGALDEPDSGTIRLGDIDVASLAPNKKPEFRNVHTGFVFQDHLLLPELTCEQNVLVPVLGRYKQEHGERARSLLERLGIAHRAKAYPWQMSGGERQRAAIARAVLLKPDVLLCDEPTGNLDEASGSEVLGLLMEQGSTESGMLILATHNLAHAERCDEVLRLHEGKFQEWSR